MNDDRCESLGIVLRVLAYFTGDCTSHSKTMNATIHKISEYSELLSFSSWMIAQIPQILENYLEKDVEGMSFHFLVTWCMADLGTFFSCLMNHAIFDRTFVSAYNCSMDAIICWQYYHYKLAYSGPKYGLSKRKNRRRRRRKGRKNKKSGSKVNRRNLQQYKPAKNTDTAKALNSIKSTKAKIDTLRKEVSKVDKAAKKVAEVAKSDGSVASKVGKTVKTVAKVVQTASVIVGANALPISRGYIQPMVKKDNSILHFLLGFFPGVDEQQFSIYLGYASSFLYIGSRLPQIFENISEQSSKGLSLKLVVFVLIGNIFYSISLLTSKNAIVGGKKSAEFWEDDLCYLVGSVGTIVFDIFLIVQYVYYDIVHFCKEALDEINDSDSDSDSDSEAGPPLVGHCPRSPALQNSSQPIDLPDVLSPKHIRKLSEHTPLTPIDFLADDYDSITKKLKKPIDKKAVIDEIESSLTKGKKA